MEDRLTKVTDAASNATAYYYDEFQRLTKEAPPGGSSYATSYQYDLLDQLVTRTAPGSVVTAYVYDTARRLTKLDLPSGETDHTYQYNVMGSLTRGRDGIYGHTVGSDTVDDWFLEYNTDGALTREWLAGINASTRYSFGDRKIEFDKAGRRTKQSFKSDNRTGYLNLDTYTTFTYDSSKHWLNQVARGGAGNTSQKADYEYDSSDGVVTKMTYGNGAYVTYDYNGSGALTKISHYSAGATLIASNAYEFDEAGNVTKLTLDDDLGAGHTGDAYVTYQYDNLYRLTREYCNATSSYRKEYTLQYTYDSRGNRSSKYYYDGSSWYVDTYNYSSRNELESFYEDATGKSWTLQYDLRGNLTKKYNDEEYDEETETYNDYIDYYWSSRDLLTKVHIYCSTDQIDKTVQYKYDLMGRRIAKKVDSGDWNWYFYDGLKVIAEGTATNDKIFYTNGPGAIGGIICRDKNGTKYWYHFDRLGNVVGVTDASGNVVSLYTMEAFGTVLEMTNGGDFSNERSTDVQPYHLTTKEYDADSGLYYFNARWYDPDTGRFILEDQGSHKDLYKYADGNPIRKVDVTGYDTTVVGGNDNDRYAVASAAAYLCDRLTRWDIMDRFQRVFPYEVGQGQGIGCCMERCCKKGLKIHIDGFWCRHLDILGYHSICNARCEFHICPVTIPVMPTAPKKPSPLVVGVIAHELAHSCGANESMANLVYDPSRPFNWWEQPPPNWWLLR